MPVNYLHSLFHRVESGWDPISREYAREYAGFAAARVDVSIVDHLEQQAGGLIGKRVLDLGGGPGQYSVLFAQRGADVTWHDVSREYQSIAEALAAREQLKIHLSLGYLEDAARLRGNPFDLVFCRVCWYYGRNDRRFAQILYSLLKPGGIGYIECNTPAFSNPAGVRKLQHWLNEFLGWKIGHPMPPRGRIAKLIQQRSLSSLHLDYSSPLLDVVEFVKAA
jgi:2-polyprenyl-3-methyl-5-hydroxy-6-metoxy-1,4-benzoquinol methylase